MNFHLPSQNSSVYSIGYLEERKASLVVLHYEASIQEAEVGGSLQVQGHTGLQ